MFDAAPGRSNRRRGHPDLGSGEATAGVKALGSGAQGRSPLRSWNPAKSISPTTHPLEGGIVGQVILDGRTRHFPTKFRFDEPSHFKGLEAVRVASENLPDSPQNLTLCHR